MSPDSEQQLRRYAAGQLSWSLLRARTPELDNYRDVLAGLGALGLRPPVASDDGPNWETRKAGRMLLREALSGRT